MDRAISASSARPNFEYIPLSFPFMINPCRGKLEDDSSLHIFMIASVLTVVINAPFKDAKEHPGYRSPVIFLMPGRYLVSNWTCVPCQLPHQ